MRLQTLWRNLAMVIAACALCLTAAAATPAPTVTVFAAGSLREVVGDLATQARSLYGIEVNATFGGSGTLRGRIEHGVPADLLLSADMASPERLAALGRTVVPALPFARNRICIVAPRTAGIDAGNFVDHLLAAGTRVWASEPVADPGGDYAAEIFRRIDATHPGASARLAARAAEVRVSNEKIRIPEGRSRFGVLFALHQIDVLITYCSGVPALETEVPELASFPVPPALDPHPVYGMAVLADRPAALRLALYLLSPAGQAILADRQFVPLVAP